MSLGIPSTPGGRQRKRGSRRGWRRGGARSDRGHEARVRGGTESRSWFSATPMRGRSPATDSTTPNHLLLVRRAESDMEKPWIRFSKWPYEESMLYFEVEASD